MALYGMAPPAFRLPAETTLGRARLQVQDLERSLDYYERVLGMRAVERRGSRLTLAPHGDDTPLIELHARPDTRPVPRTGLLGLYHFAILLPDRSDLGRFVAHIGSQNERAGLADHAVSEAVYLTDPDGLGIEVYADRPRSTWRADGDELHMTTERLDVEDLLRAGGGDSWAGMPAGTRLGHMHLHVGDLARASDFYYSALGFDKTVWSYPGALFLSAGGYHHHLGTNTWRAGSPPAAENDARLLEWEIVVPDERASADAARSVTAAGYAVSREADTWVAADPWGTRVRLCIRRVDGFAPPSNLRK
jgi:catechol 2,3-dioxygenase